MDQLVDRIPMVKAATQEAAEAATQQIKAKLRIQLREERVCPQQKDMLGNYILNFFLRSLVSPGETVGISASEGIGGPATQMALSGFHNAGSAKNVGSGVDIMRELLNMSLKRRVESTVIHFRDKNLTFEDVLEHRRNIVGVTVKDLLKSTPSIISSFDGAGVKIPYNQRGWWYEAYISIMKLGFPQSQDLLAAWEGNHYLRLEINRTRMFAFNLTPHDVAKTIEAELSGSLKCIVSPSISSRCIIDVYPNQLMIAEIIKKRLKGEVRITMSDKNIALIFLNQIIAPDLDKYIIKGIKNISQIFPKTERTISIIRFEKAYREIDIEEELERSGNSQNEEQRKYYENTWDLWIDRIKLQTTGIPISKITKLLTMCGFTIVSSPEDPNVDNYYSIDARPRRKFLIEPLKFTVVLKPEMYGKKPNEIINEILAEDDKKMNADVKVRKRRVVVLSSLGDMVRVPGGSPRAGIPEGDPRGLRATTRWSIGFDQGKLDKNKIKKEEVEELLAYAELKVVKFDDTGLEVETDFKKHLKAYFDIKVPQSDRFAAPVVTELGKAGSYTYAESNGSNLRATLAHELIDPKRSISNNANDIYNIISLQATYSFITKDFYDTILANSAYCSPRHITTLVSFMTNVCPRPITSRGVSTHNRGAFADASFEYAVDAFIKSAIVGANEGVDATSASIFLGSRGKYGTGAFQLGIDENAIAEIRKAVAEEGETIAHRVVDIKTLGISQWSNPQMQMSELGEDKEGTGVDVNAIFSPDPMISISKIDTPMTNIAALPVPGEMVFVPIKSVSVKYIPKDMVTVPYAALAIVPDFLKALLG